jgi:hypothetical protein
MSGWDRQGATRLELALSTDAMQAFLHWSLAICEAGRLTMAHPERVAGLLDRVKHLEAVALTCRHQDMA